MSLPKNTRKSARMVLKGYQSVLTPSKKYDNFTMSVLIEEDDLVESLEEEAAAIAATTKENTKNPKRAIIKPVTWLEEVDDQPGQWKLKFNWKKGQEPTITDTEGTVITNPKLPIYEGTVVRIAYHLRGYIQTDKLTVGVKPVLLGVRVLELPRADGFKPLKADEMSDLFGDDDEGFTLEHQAEEGDSFEDGADEGDDTEENPF